MSDLFGFRRLMMAGAGQGQRPVLVSGDRGLAAAVGGGLYHGLATALYALPASAVIAKVYPAARGQRMGTYSAAENAGVVLGPVLGGSGAHGGELLGRVCRLGVIGALALATMIGVPVTVIPRRQAGSVVGSARRCAGWARRARDPC